MDYMETHMKYEILHGSHPLLNTSSFGRKLVKNQGLPPSNPNRVKIEHIIPDVPPSDEPGWMDEIHWAETAPGVYPIEAQNGNGTNGTNSSSADGSGGSGSGTRRI